MKKLLLCISVFSVAFADAATEKQFYKTAPIQNAWKRFKHWVNPTSGSEVYKDNERMVTQEAPAYNLASTGKDLAPHTWRESYTRQETGKAFAAASVATGVGAVVTGVLLGQIKKRVKILHDAQDALKQDKGNVKLQGAVSLARKKLAAIIILGISAGILTGVTAHKALLPQIQANELYRNPARILANRVRDIQDADKESGGLWKKSTSELRALVKPELQHEFDAIGKEKAAFEEVPVVEAKPESARLNKPYPVVGMRKPGSTSDDDVYQNNQELLDAQRAWRNDPMDAQKVQAAREQAAREQAERNLMGVEELASFDVENASLSDDGVVPEMDHNKAGTHDKMHLQQIEFVRNHLKNSAAFEHSAPVHRDGDSYGIHPKQSRAVVKKALKASKKVLEGKKKYQKLLNSSISGAAAGSTAPSKS